MFQPTTPSMLFRRAASVALGLYALVMCNACSDSSHAARQTNAGGRQPAQQSLLLDPQPDKELGRVLGTVSAAHGGQPVALHGATVSLKDATGRIAGDTARSDVEGHFEIPSHRPGTYRLCAEAPGFTPSCVPEPVTIQDDTRYVAYGLTLRAAAGGLRGRVLLADGSPCFQYSAAFGTLVFAEVSLSGPQGSVTAAGNSRGEFVLAGLPGAGKYSLTAKCQGGQVTKAIALTAAHLNGRKSLGVALPNSRPVIRLLVPQDEHGQALRAFTPGQTIRVVAEVFDPDSSDALSFKWTDGTPGLKSANARVISWTLPDVEARSFLNVEVSDGKGGYAVDQLSVGTSNTGARFLGTLADPNGKALAKATVTVDGERASVDEEGNFRAAVPDGDRHVLTIQHPGYAPISKIFYGPAPGLKLTLNPATHQTIDPSKPIRVSARGVSFSLEPNQLVDEDGKRPTGPLNLYIYRYDASRGELPGDPTALSAEQTASAFSSMGGVYVGILDDEGKRYDIAPGGNASLTFSTSAIAGANSLRAAPVLASYDEAKGSWAVRNSATPKGARSNETSIARLGVWSVGIPSGDTACLQVSVDLFTLERPFNLRLHVPGAGPTLRDFTIAEPITLIPLLPASVKVRLEVTSLDAPSRPISTFSANTGPNLSSPIPPFPYTACGDGVKTGFVKLAAKLPSKVWLDRFGGSDDQSLSYYASIGAIPAKVTFTSWLLANGFTSVDQQNEVVFYNPNELGLGRKVNCKRSQFHQACYVTKYGHVGASPFEAFDDTLRNTNPGDTVAMESDRADTSKPPKVRFYIYRPNGLLVTNTLFDTSGPKFVPNSCQHCHGGFKPENGNFVVLDPHAYQYPGLSAQSPHALDAQQEKFRLINETVAFSHVHTGPYYDFLNTLYPDGAPVGVHKAGAKAIPAPVPPAWQEDAFVYNNVVKPSCRTCHMWQGAGQNFATPNDVQSLSVGYACVGLMPAAMSPMLRLWRTTNPNLIHAFADSRFDRGFLGCSDKGTPPKLTVLAPVLGVSAGKPAVHQAIVTDQEDGQDCCTVRWRSDKDGELGVGREIQFTYKTKGPRTITAFAADKDGRIAVKSFTLDVRSNVPKIAVLAPSGPVGYGGLNVVLHKASVTDVEDGPNCCQVVWNSDKDGKLGVGQEVEFVYTSAGPRTITVTATDSDGATDSQSFALDVMGSPPSAIIETPAVGAAIFQNTAVVAEAHGFDPNEVFSLPCTSLTWKSSNASDTSFPFTGCAKTISFATTGTRTITVTAVDKDGLTATATRQLQVQAVPAQSPPIVSIVDPHDRDLLDPNTPKALNGAVNPGAGAVTFRWTIDSGRGEVDIGSTQTLSWIPGNNLPFHCGGNSGVLKLYGTNAKGTGSTSINVSVLYPVC